MTETPATALADAARALMLAGRWAQARALLRAARADEAESAVLAVAAAEVATDQDFWLRTTHGASALAAASAAVAAGARADLSFDVEFLQLKADYTAELFSGGDGAPARGPSGHDAAALGSLSSRAASLAAAAPDREREAQAAFYAGLVADVLLADADTARSWYERTLAAAESVASELMMSYALRHLAFLDPDPSSARDQHQRSLELRQRAGCVPHVLAQQLELAELARDAGDTAWCEAVAAQVRSWAAGLSEANGGRAWLSDAAAALLPET